MPSYIELDKQSSFPSSSNTGKMIFGVNTSNEATLTDSNGTTYNFGSGSTNNLNYQTYEIDLQTGNYSINNIGIYRISNGDGSAVNVISFPRPSDFNGGTIILINNDNNLIQDAYFGGDYFPFSLGSNEQITFIRNRDMLVFYSINGQWRGGRG